MRIGVSSCLVGEQCRYNGAGSNDDFLTKVIKNYFEIFTYCPEATVFGTPRDAIRLVNIDGEIKVHTVNGGIDLTEPLSAICNEYALDIKAKKLCGFILKSKSPSCGMERVKLYEKDSYLCEKKATGVFAQAIKDINPYLPLEEEGRLEDDWLRENFMMNVYAYSDLQQFLDTKPEMKELIEFHTSYKYLIFSKSQKSYKDLGRIVANKDKIPLEEILELYKDGFLKAVSQKSSINKTYNVLLHIFGYFKNDLESVEKQEILRSFDEFKDQVIPLVVPIKMLQLYVNKFQQSYLVKQKFLRPYPDELRLRSSIEASK
jgi:uncharacterized protein YbgA (DUF1722 family)/uncharacterized protein YbbK (DUF523 family)